MTHSSPSVRRIVCSTLACLCIAPLFAAISGCGEKQSADDAKTVENAQKITPPKPLAPGEKPKKMLAPPPP